MIHLLERESCFGVLSLGLALAGFSQIRRPTTEATSEVSCIFSDHINLSASR
jgi:hypothetical protein